MNSLPAEERERVLRDLFEEPSPPVVDGRDVTDAEVRDALRGVAYGSPGYTYSAPGWMDPDTEGVCFYVHHAFDDQDILTPGCMVGHALNRLGIPLHVLVQHEDRPASDIVEEFFPQTSEETLHAYTWAQSRQDCGRTWGQAIRDAGLG